MGSGPRFQFWFAKGLIFGVTVERFPYDWTVTVAIGCAFVSYGFGRAYDDPSNSTESINGNC